MSVPPCRHCHRHPAHRPRGLCFNCYKNRGIRNRYPSAAPRRGTGLGARKNAGLPKKPTTAKPGTPETVEVMGERAAEDRRLFHPRDARHGELTGEVPESFVALLQLVLMAGME